MNRANRAVVVTTSMVALLVSLWEAIESPFSAMDEFDVFMVRGFVSVLIGSSPIFTVQDAANRQVTVRLLLEFAAIYRNRQYIFISPQADLCGALVV